jgi:hypothetical protein
MTCQDTILHTHQTLATLQGIPAILAIQHILVGTLEVLHITLLAILEVLHILLAIQAVILTQLATLEALLTHQATLEGLLILATPVDMFILATLEIQMGGIMDIKIWFFMSILVYIIGNGFGIKQKIARKIVLLHMVVVLFPGGDGQHRCQVFYHCQFSLN